jgi:hypothetical protein
MRCCSCEISVAPVARLTRVEASSDMNESPRKAKYRGILSECGLGIPQRSTTIPTVAVPERSPL